jgi:hypothetical protein
MGNVLDEAGVFEERLVMATIDLSKATREPALRTLGKASGPRKTYGPGLEHPAYAAWMEAGLKLVRRLDGKAGVLTSRTSAEDGSHRTARAV